MTTPEKKKPRDRDHVERLHAGLVQSMDHHLNKERRYYARIYGGIGGSFDRYCVISRINDSRTGSTLRETRGRMKFVESRYSPCAALFYEAELEALAKLDPPLRLSFMEYDDDMTVTLYEIVRA